MGFRLFPFICAFPVILISRIVMSCAGFAAVPPSTYMADPRHTRCFSEAEESRLCGQIEVGRTCRPFEINQKLKIVSPRPAPFSVMLLQGIVIAATPPLGRGIVGEIEILNTPAGKATTPPPKAHAARIVALIAWVSSSPIYAAPTLPFPSAPYAVTDIVCDVVALIMPAAVMSKKKRIGMNVLLTIDKGLTSFTAPVWILLCDICRSALGLRNHSHPRQPVRTKHIMLLY